MNYLDLQLLSLIDEKKNLFITGAAGTGKSWYLNEIYKYLKSKNIQVYKLAPTHTSANKIQGYTIHSFFSINPYDNKYNINIDAVKNLHNIQECEYLLIDEISMINKILFDSIYHIAYMFNICLILFGDFCQLPPIIIYNSITFQDIEYAFSLKNKNDDANVITKKYSYEDFIKIIKYYMSVQSFAYNSHYWETIHTYKLVTNYRVINKDINNLLLNARLGTIKLEDISINKFSSYDLSLLDNNYVLITSLYKYIDYIWNMYILNYKENYIKIKTKSITNISNKNKTSSFYFNLFLYPGLHFRLALKEDKYNKYDTGTIEEIINEGKIKCKMYDNNIIYLSPKELNEKDAIQFPIIPDNFITVHKAQGLEFDNIIIIVDDLFEVNHFYTAISRGKKNIRLVTLYNKYTLDNLNNINNII